MIARFVKGYAKFSFTEAQVGQICYVSRLWTGNDTLVIGSELFVNGGLNLRIPERIPQLSGIFIQESGYYDKPRVKDLSIQELRMLVNAFSKCRSVDFDNVNNELEIITR